MLSHISISTPGSHEAYAKLAIHRRGQPKQTLQRECRSQGGGTEVKEYGGVNKEKFELHREAHEVHHGSTQTANLANNLDLFHQSGNGLLLQIWRFIDRHEESSEAGSIQGDCSRQRQEVE